MKLEPPSKTTSEIMKRIKSSGSKIEVALTKALWAKGLRYRKNDKSVFGKPDLTFNKIKVAIFVDSEFWHGKDWERQKSHIGHNRDYWAGKILKNKDRDKTVNKYLRTQGWTVLRFWGKDINKKLNICVNKIIKTIKKLN